jgi:hypothetical protein
MRGWLTLGMALAAEACVDLSRPPQLSCPGGACTIRDDVRPAGADATAEAATPAGAVSAMTPPGPDAGPVADPLVDAHRPDAPGAAADGERVATDASFAPPDGAAAAPDGRSGGGPGAACAVAADCTSGVCADGVCCASSCQGPCMSCSRGGRVGTCSPVSAGAPCAEARCNGATLSPAASCDGQGSCSHPADVACGAAQCTAAENRCVAVCITAADCAPPASECRNGTCQMPTSCDGAPQGAACGAGKICVGGACIVPSYLTVGGTVSASDPGSPPEDMTRAFDRNVDTKWYVGSSATPTITYELPAARVVVAYQIGSGNDAPDRDPRSWVLEGSNDGVAWIAVDGRTDQSFTARKTLNSYDVASGVGYSRYRLRILATRGSTATQLSELQLYGY